MKSIIVQQSWINDSEFIGYYVAAAEGLYASAGLAVSFYPGHAGLTPEHALLEGTADIALCAPESVAATIAQSGASLRIIAAQFQKSPLGIVSLASDPVLNLPSLMGRTLAVPEMNRAMIEELLARAGLRTNDVAIVPYHHDLAPLIDRTAVGLVDFIVDPQYRLQTAAIDTHAILLYDHGAPLPNNLAVVTEQTYMTQRTALASWVDASRLGWTLNYRDPALYPRILRGAPLVKSRTLEQEIYANRAFQPMVESSTGTMSLGADLINNMISYMDRVDVHVDVSTFAPLA